MTVSFTLPVSDVQGLASFLKVVDNPSSPYYHKFLSDKQFSSLFGPDANEFKALEAYLQSYGLSVNYGGSSLASNSPNLFTLKATGGVQQIEQALKTQVRQFSYKGSTFMSATQPASLPSQFSNVVKVGGLTVSSLSMNATRHVAMPLYRTLYQKVNGPAQNTNNFMFYSPSEIDSMYNITSLHDQGINGSGVTISIVDAWGDPFIQSEVNQFDHEFGLANQTINVICVDGPCDYSLGVDYGWNTEIALDVEWAHALAPAATINLYIGSNDGPALYDGVEAAVLGTNGNGTYYSPSSVISLSWGEPENDFGTSVPVDPLYGVNYPWLNQVLQQAAAEGMTVFAASGDWGAYDQNFGQTSPYGGAIYPSTDPFVTGVGGTSLYGASTNGFLQYPYENATTAYGSETAWSWNNVYGWSTGGGCSTLFGSQAWQNTGSFCTGQRGDPDVAWDADVQTGVVVNVQGTDYIVGGTSVGAPSWAGSMALIDQSAGRELGWINPALYSLGGTAYANAFHDVTTGNNNPDSAAPGWDELTGLGSPNVGYLAQYLSSPPTGLSVAVSLATGPSFTPYGLGGSVQTGSVLDLVVNVTNAGVNVTEGTVNASVYSTQGALEESGALAYNSTMDLWTGSFAIAASAQPGEWTAVVDATNGTSAGRGYAVLAAGDGITLDDNTCFSCFYLPGYGIDMGAMVFAPNGSAITTGTYTARFNLGGPNGTFEGSVPLTYTGSDWEGFFVIPPDADQGPWTMTVRGADNASTLGSTYTWLNVGLEIEPQTDSPTYVMGDTMEIAAYTGAPGGTFTATISQGSTIIANVPLTFAGLLDGGFYGSYTFNDARAVGFDTVTVSGGDGQYYGSFATIVRVAPQTLNVAVAFSKPTIAVNDPSCTYDNSSGFYNCGETVMAHVTYPGGATVTQGNVEAFVYLMGSAEALQQERVLLTYNSSLQDFIGAVEVPAIGPSPFLPAIGNYSASVAAYDPAGNFGEYSNVFYVHPLAHDPIVIESDEDFNGGNGVVAGNGSVGNPYLIEGWQTTAIHISGVSSSYVVTDNLVSGSLVDGIYLSTWGVPMGGMPIAWYNFELNNALNGLHIYDFAGPVIGFNMAGGNLGNGTLIDDSPGVTIISNSQAAASGANGISYFNSPGGYSGGSVSIGNFLSGLLLVNSPDSEFDENTAVINQVGINDTGSDLSAWYNSAFMNNVGEFVNGLWQVPEDDLVPVSPSQCCGLYTSDWHGEDIEDNGVGMLSVNNAVVGNWDGSYLGNNWGLVSNNSTLLMEFGTEAYNTYSGVALNGMPTSGETVNNEECGPVVGAAYVSVVDCNFAYNNGYGDPSPNVSVKDMEDVVLLWNQGYSAAGNDTELVNVEYAKVMYTTAVSSGGDGFYAKNVNYSYFIVASLPSEWCQDVCDLSLPAAAGYGLHFVGGENDVTTYSYFYSNGAGGASFAGTEEDYIGANGSPFQVVYLDSNGGPGISASNSGYLYIDTTDVGNNLGNGIDVTASNYTWVVSSTVYNNSMSSPIPSFDINVDPSSMNTTVVNNVINYSWAGIGFVATSNDNATNNLICHNFIGIYVDNAVNGTYAPNNFCSNSHDTYFAPPVDGSYTITGTGTVVVGVTNAFYADVSNNLLYKPSAIVWFEVDNSASQVVLVAGVSPDVGPLQSGTVYLALGTLPPGTYHIRAFAVTDSGVPLSNVVVTPTTVT